MFLLHVMSEEQLSAFLAALRADTGLQERLKGAADLDAALAIAKEAGFDVSKADWLKYQAKQTLALSDEELEAIAGGDDTTPTLCYCAPTRVLPGTGDTSGICGC